MKNTVIILLLLVICNSILKSQDPGKTEISKNTIYYELGTILVVSSTSLNYERLVYRAPSEKLFLFGRAGIGGAAIYWGNAGWGGLAALTMLTGNKKAHFEANAGLFSGWQTPAFASESRGNWFYVPILDLGFRYQKPGKGFLFRAKAGSLGVGLGAGYSF